MPTSLITVQLCPGDTVTVRPADSEQAVASTNLLRPDRAVQG